MVSFHATTGNFVARSRGRSIQRGMWFEGFVLLTMLGLSAILGLTAFGDERRILGVSTLFSIAQLFTGLKAVQVAGGRLFGPTVVFILALFVTHYGQFWLESVDLNGTQYFGKQYGVETINRTILIVFLGTSSAVAGAIWAAGRFSRLPAGSRGTTMPPEKAFLVAGVLLMMVSLPAAVSIARNVFALTVQGTYSNIYTQNASQGLENWDSVLAGFLPCSAFLILMGSRARSWIILAICVILCSSIVSGVSGRRTETLLPLIAFAWIYSVRIKPLKIGRIALLAGILLVVVSPIMSRMRLVKGEQKLTATAVLDSWQSMDNPLIAQLNETGFTALTVSDTLNLVPKVRPFDLGLGYFNAAAFSLPRFLMPYDALGGEGPPSVWLIREGHPQLLGTGLFYGYSAIAESYLQFGWLGSIFVMFAITVAISKLEQDAVVGGSIFALIISAVGIIWLPHFARGHIMELVRPLLWHGGGAALLVVVLARGLSMRSTRPVRLQRTLT